MSELKDPLDVRWEDSLHGMEIVRQAAPPGAASFAATYVAPAGWAYDPAGQEGLAALTGALVTSGAGRRDRVALARYLDQLGATLAHHTAPESTEVTVWGPTSEGERLLELLADVILRPRLAVDDLERIRRQLFVRQLREMTQPAGRAERELLRTIFPTGHPYSSSGVGTRRSVRRIRRADVARFHGRQFTSEAALLAVTATLPAARLRTAVRRIFAPLDRRAPSAPSIPTVRPRHRSVTIPMPGQSQVEVRIGGPSIPRHHPEYPALFLANEVLGGRPLLSRLFQTVREERGLAYHASSDIETMSWGGYWAAEAGTGADRWRRVLPVVRAELARIDREPVAARELNQIRESAIGEIPLGLETTAGAHEIAVDIGYHHLPGDFYRTWPSELRRLSSRDLLEAAADGLAAQHAVTVVAGPVG
jgi:zinc protease